MGKNEDHVTPDSNAGLKWLFKAALQGQVYAISELGKAYENGTGVDKDYSEAYKFYRLAAEKNGVYVVAYINPLSAKMTADQIQEGERRLKEFQNTPLEKRSLRMPSLANKLRLQGIVLGAKPIVMVNGKSLQVGESVSLKVDGCVFRVRCDEIKQGYVVLSVAETGEKIRLEQR